MGKDLIEVLRNGVTVKIEPDRLRWGIDNLDCYTIPGELGPTDATMHRLLLKSIFAEEIETKVIGRGARDEDASRVLNDNWQFIKVEHYLNGEIIDGEYLSVLDIVGIKTLFGK